MSLYSRVLCHIDPAVVAGWGKESHEVSTGQPVWYPIVAVGDLDARQSAGRPGGFDYGGLSVDVTQLTSESFRRYHNTSWLLGSLQNAVNEAGGAKLWAGGRNTRREGMAS